MMNADTFSEFIKDAEEFINTKVRPFAGIFEQKEAIPSEIIQEVADRKYLAAPFPEEYGGLDLDPVQYGLLSHEIGKGCPSLRSLVTVHTSLVGETLLRIANSNQKSYWLPLMASGKKIAAFGLTEPEIGSDAKNVKTSYKKEGNQFVISGRKKWITFAHLADFFLIIASQESNVTAFIVERERNGVSTTPIKGMIAGKAAYIAEIELNEVKVPEENIVGKINDGFSIVVNTALDYGRYSIAWAATALAEAALEEMVRYVRKREQFGNKIHKYQLIHKMIADAVTKVQTSKKLCLKAGELRKEKSDEAIILTTIAKYFTSKIAMEVAIDAVQIHGGNGCCNKYPVERMFREAKIFEIIEGTSQIQQEIIAAYGLRKYFKPKLSTCT